MTWLDTITISQFPLIQPHTILIKPLNYQILKWYTNRANVTNGHIKKQKLLFQIQRLDLRENYKRRWSGKLDIPSMYSAPKSLRNPAPIFLLYGEGTLWDVFVGSARKANL